MHRAQERISVEGVLNTIRNQERAVKDRESEEDLLIQVGRWLVEAGFDPQIARECAKEALARNGAVLAHDLAPVRQDAFALAMARSTEAKGTFQPEEHTSKNHKNISYGQKDLRAIFEAGKKAGISTYHAMKNAGVLRSASEYEGVI